ncbi:MAG: zinc ribbon domain-containing protein [Thermoproteus sp.]
MSSVGIGALVPLAPSRRPLPALLVPNIRLAYSFVDVTLPCFEPTNESFRINIWEAEGRDMGKNVYRTLVLKYDLLRLPPEVAGKVPALLRVQEEFRKWATEWTKSGRSLPLPERNPLKYLAKKFLYVTRFLDLLKGMEKNGVEVRGMKPPLVFDAQLRLDDERDIGMGVFVDLPKREVRIRKWSGKKGNTITLPLGDKTVEWILDRVREGGRLTLAMVWIGKSKRNHAIKLYVALVFRREAAPIEAKRLLAIDLNALHNGISWAVVEEGRILKKDVLRPDVSKILHLQKVVSRLDRACAEKDERCNEAMAVKSRIWRLLRSWEDEAVKELIWMARKRKAVIVVDIPDDETMRKLKESNYASERKTFLNLGRIRRRLRGLAEWYGIPFHKERLYSTVCPRCGRKMSVLPDRRVRCACGFEAHRDEVPALWAMKRFPELISFSSSSAVLRVTTPAAAWWVSG